MGVPLANSSATWAWTSFFSAAILTASVNFKVPLSAACWSAMGSESTWSQRSRVRPEMGGWNRLAMRSRRSPLTLSSLGDLPWRSFAIRLSSRYDRTRSSRLSCRR